MHHWQTVASSLSCDLGDFTDAVEDPEIQILGGACGKVREAEHRV